MKALGTIVFLFASVFAFAQNRFHSLDLRIQAGYELTRPNQFILYQTGNPDNLDYMAQPDYQRGVQVRMIGELPGAPNFYYNLGGRLETSSQLNCNFEVNGASINTDDVQVDYSYFSFGGAYIFNWNFGLSIGAHIEGRLERISSSGPVFIDIDGVAAGGGMDGSATLLRPWFRLSMDFTFNNSGVVRPFIGVEGAYPILKREQGLSRWAVGQPQDKRLMESLAPQGSAAVYFGFRL